MLQEDLEYGRKGRMPFGHPGVIMGATFAAWLLVSSVLSGGPGEDPGPGGRLARFEFEETHMASPFHLVLYSTDEATARRASRAAFDRIEALNIVLSDYDPESELSRLSQSAGKGPVRVSADLFDVLDRSKRMSELSDGAFDVTIAPVGRLWRRARRDQKLPDPRLIAEARKLVGSDKMVLDPAARTVRLLVPGMKLDVGGIAKGYAAQAALDVLRSMGILRALVGGAGDIVAGDPPPDAQGWRIAIAPVDPRLSYRPPTLLLNNAAVSTAGDAERFVEIDGHRYSHIVNPRTGMGHEDRAAVTVVAPDGGTADALETTAYLLGPERGLKLVDETPGAAALFQRLTPDGVRTFESSRFRQVPKVQDKDATTPADVSRP
jgi:thiamine biosynthesis lipoprotein